jgi:UDP-2,3-diacylglucosamine pyrophosphatase LpxH
LYVNTGDFVESCTAIVEHHDGRLELINWLDRSPLLLTAA